MGSRQNSSACCRLERVSVSIDEKKNGERTSQLSSVSVYRALEDFQG